MPLLLGALVMWSGYQLVVYGYQQIRGGNIGFADLAWPGRTVDLNPDMQGSGAGGGSDSTTPGGSTSTPPAGWTPIPAGQVPAGGYVNPSYPNEVWVPGQGLLQV